MYLTEEEKVDTDTNTSTSNGASKTSSSSSEEELLDKKHEIVRAMYTAKNIQETLAVYEKYANLYDETHAQTWKGPNELALVASTVVMPCAVQRSKATVLDFGAGTGMSGLALQKHGFAILDACDISPEMMEKAQTNTNQLYRQFLVGTLGQSVTIAPETYDLITAAGIIGTHVGAPELAKVLCPLVKPGGSILYTIKVEADDAEEFQTLYASLHKIGLKRKHVQEVGPLNVDVPWVNHRIVSLVRD